MGEALRLGLSCKIWAGVIHLIFNYFKAKLEPEKSRVSYSGNTPVFQTGDGGSIPPTR